MSAIQLDSTTQLDRIEKHTSELMGLLDPPKGPGKLDELAKQLKELEGRLGQIEPELRSVTNVLFSLESRNGAALTKLEQIASTAAALSEPLKDGAIRDWSESLSASSDRLQATVSEVKDAIAWVEQQKRATMHFAKALMALALACLGMSAWAHWDARQLRSEAMAEIVKYARWAEQNDRSINALRQSIEQPKAPAPKR